MSSFLVALVAPALGRAQETPPTPGEKIRLEIAPQIAVPLGITSPWEGTFVMVRQDNLVASNPFDGGVALPLSGVDVIRVQRDRDPSYAVVRGAIVGGAFGIGMWRFLKVLCRRGCEGGMQSAWFPAVGSGLLVGVLVGGQGPGDHWVRASVPEPEPAAGPVGATFSVPLPGRR